MRALAARTEGSPRYSLCESRTLHVAHGQIRVSLARVRGSEKQPANARRSRRWTRVSARRSSSKRRSRREESHEEFDGQVHGDVDFSPERLLLGREMLARATAVLLELPERTRVIFVLRRLEGMRYLDIAARLGISVSAVAVARARRTVDRDDHTRSARLLLLGRSGKGLTRSAGPIG